MHASLDPRYRRVCIRLLAVDPSPGPVGEVTDQELIALAVPQAVTGLVSDRKFVGTVGRLLPGFFPRLPDQSQFNRRLRRLTPWITTMQLGVAELVATGDVRLVDGILLGAPTTPAVHRTVSSPGTPPTATAPPRASGTGACSYC